MASTWMIKRQGENGQWKCTQIEIDIENVPDFTVTSKKFK